MSNTTVTKIEKYIINIAGTKIELTPEQAKELRDILTELTGAGEADWQKVLRELGRIRDEKPPVTIPYPVPYPQPYPVWPKPREWWEVPTITWTTTNSPCVEIACKA